MTKLSTPPFTKQVAQLLQRDRDAGWVMAKSGRLALGDNIYGHYSSISTNVTHLPSKTIKFGE